MWLKWKNEQAVSKCAIFLDIFCTIFTLNISYTSSIILLDKIKKHDFFLVNLGLKEDMLTLSANVITLGVFFLRQQPHIKCKLLV
jgi:hypothetical protein